MYASFQQQPKAFRMIFMLEIWERFGYYVVQGILTLYFMRYLGMNDVDAYYTYGAFAALVYGITCLGGYLGDKVLGIKRTIVLGLCTLSLGYFCLAFANQQTIYYALGLICIGNGLFKANPSNLLSKAYVKDDPRLHGGFTLYYMAVNLGSIFALFAGPSIAAHYGYKAAYLLSGVGILIALANYSLNAKSVQSISDISGERSISVWIWALVGLSIGLSTILCAYLLKHVSIAKQLVWGIAIATLIPYGYVLSKQARETQLKMIVALILIIEAVLFFILYQQMPTSMTLFAVNNVESTLIGIPINPQSFQALNPLWIVSLSPLMVAWYHKLAERGILFTIPYKFALGMLSCALSFIVLFLSRYYHSEGGVVSSWWLVGSYFFQSIGELFVSALGVAMVAELVPASIAGFVMGMWFLATGISGFLGASVAAYTALPENLTPGIDSLMIYTRVFGYIGLITLIMSALMWLSAKRLSRYIQPAHTITRASKTAHENHPSRTEVCIN